jgi:hypothetical protein
MRRGEVSQVIGGLPSQRLLDLRCSGSDAPTVTPCCSLRTKRTDRHARPSRASGFVLRRDSAAGPGVGEGRPSMLCRPLSPPPMLRRPYGHPGRNPAASAVFDDIYDGICDSRRNVATVRSNPPGARQLDDALGRDPHLPQHRAEAASRTAEAVCPPAPAIVGDHRGAPHRRTAQPAVRPCAPIYLRLRCY